MMLCRGSQHTAFGVGGLILPPRVEIVDIYHRQDTYMKPQTLRYRRERSSAPAATACAASLLRQLYLSRCPRDTKSPTLRVHAILHSGFICVKFIKKIPRRTGFRHRTHTTYNFRLALRQLTFRRVRVGVTGPCRVGAGTRTGLQKTATGKGRRGCLSCHKK